MVRRTLGRPVAGAAAPPDRYFRPHGSAVHRVLGRGHGLADTIGVIRRRPLSTREVRGSAWSDFRSDGSRWCRRPCRRRLRSAERRQFARAEPSMPPRTSRSRFSPARFDVLAGVGSAEERLAALLEPDRRDGRRGAGSGARRRGERRVAVSRAGPTRTRRDARRLAAWLDARAPRSRADRAASAPALVSLALAAGAPTPTVTTPAPAPLLTTQSRTRPTRRGTRWGRQARRRGIASRRSRRRCALSPASRSRPARPWCSASTSASAAAGRRLGGSLSGGLRPPRGRSDRADRRRAGRRTRARDCCAPGTSSARGSCRRLRTSCARR